MEFMGYVRPDGKVGARNYVAVIPSVTCANDVANAICHQVQGTITYLHHQGCCQMPPDLERVTDTLISLGMSPNVGAILIVSLGCEGTDHERMVKEISATGKHVEIIRRARERPQGRRHGSLDGAEHRYCPQACH